VQYKFRDWIGGVADFDGHYGSIGGVGMSVHSYMFGRRCLCLRAFRRLLTCCWAERISARREPGIRRLQWQSEPDGHRNQAGNQLADHSGGLLLTRFGSSTQNNGRISTGVVSV